MTFKELVKETLADGRAHAINDLINLVDPPASRVHLRQVVCELRKTLAAQGEDVLCTFSNKRTHYRWVRIISVDD